MTQLVQIKEGWSSTELKMHSCGHLSDSFWHALTMEHHYWLLHTVIYKKRTYPLGYHLSSNQVYILPGSGKHIPCMIYWTSQGDRHKMFPFYVWLAELALESSSRCGSLLLLYWRQAVDDPHEVITGTIEKGTACAISEWRLIQVQWQVQWQDA